MSEELRPCPFCGKEPAIDNNFAICVNDDCEMSDYWSGLEDFSWNTRPIEDALKARIAELEAEIETMKLESDGSHTFAELYHHRAVLFSVVTNDHLGISWKSRLHEDGTMFDGYFIVGILTPEGMFSYHYEMKEWDLFECKELHCAPKWDGHTPDDVWRLSSLARATWNTRPIEDALNKRIAELEYQLEDWAEDYKARIAELEEEVTKGNELQDSYCDRIAKLEAYVAELEAETEVQDV